MTTLSIMGKPVNMYATKSFTLEAATALIADKTIPTNIGIVSRDGNAITVEVLNKGMPCRIYIREGTSILLTTEQSIPEWFPQDARYMEQLDINYIDLHCVVAASGSIALPDTHARLIADPDMLADVISHIGGLSHEDLHNA